MDTASIIATVKRRTGLTGKELAARAGTSASTLSAYERGLVVPSVATLDRIIRSSGLVAFVELLESPSARVPNTTIEELLTFVDQAPSMPNEKLVGPVWSQPISS
jgi:transcriptional regulator with XRE-family HTH domain